MHMGNKLSLGYSLSPGRACVLLHGQLRDEPLLSPISVSPAEEIGRVVPRKLIKDPRLFASGQAPLSQRPSLTRSWSKAVTKQAADRHLAGSTTSCTVDPLQAPLPNPPALSRPALWLHAQTQECWILSHFSLETDVPCPSSHVALLQNRGDMRSPRDRASQTNFSSKPI